MFIRNLLFVIMTGLIWGCASPVAPTGGPRDEQAPRLDSTAYSTPNYQTNFEKQTIELTFDEWVQLNNPNTEVLVSPPLEFQPAIRLKRRTVLFEFDEKEELRDSATYTINFGEAVQDLTEKNSAENLRFIFSTGAFLDSLTVSGLVIDAQTNEVLKDVRIMLYDNLADSVVRTERPFYFAKTNETGAFSIENVRADEFKFFALEDANFNYRFDQITERIAFIDENLVVSETASDSLFLRLFRSEIPPQISDVANSRFGLINLTFSGSKDSLIFQPVDSPDTLIYEYEKDSVKIWYPEASQSNWSLIVQAGETLNDTIRTEAFSKTEWAANASLLLKGRYEAGEVTNINPDRSLVLNFNYPLVAWDTSRIRLLEDSLRLPVTPRLALDSVRIRNLEINYLWKEEKIYQLRILPGGLNDIFGLSNRDTIVRDYQVRSRKNFGILTIKLQDMSPDSSYLIEVLQQNSNDPVDEFWISGQTAFERKLRSLPTGNYKIRATLDVNQNRKWDTGDYDLKRQPEPILLKDLENLRANWEVESEVSLSIDNFNIPIREARR